MTNIESLRLITEAVETAGADIAPSYTEYVQLAFAIATDCGEAGREFFHRLCRISAKYQREHAERMFSNALIKQHGEIHLGTAFHLAESTGVKICREEVMNSRKNAENALNAPYNFPTHRRAYNKVEEEENDNDENTNAPEELSTDSDPLQPLPTFPEADWPKILMLIMSYATSPTQRDILLLGALTALGTLCEMFLFRKIPVSLSANLLCSPSCFGKKRTFTYPLARGTYSRQNSPTSGRRNESLPERKEKL